MDGLRKVPSNVPNQELLHASLEKPLTNVPDPFGKFESFAHHNNAMLRDFLDRFGFSYEFMSATEAYKSGRFDETLLKMLHAYDKVMEIILPTLGPERRATYSPFLPISPRTGKVLQVPMVERHPRKGTIVYIDPDTGEKVETRRHRRRGQVSVEGGLGPALDRARPSTTRWPVRTSSTLCCSLHASVRALGGTPPEGFNYELFLDDRGEKISQVEGQRPDDRRVAEVCEPPKASRSSCSRSRRRPSAFTSTSFRAPSMNTCSSFRHTAARTTRASWTTPSGIFTTATRRLRMYRSPSRSCSTLSPPPTPTTRKCSGVSSSPPRQRRQPRDASAVGREGRLCRALLRPTS